MGLSTGLLECSHDMAAGFPQHQQPKKPRWKLYNLALEVSHCHLHHTLLVTQTSLDLPWEEQEVRVIWAIWEAGTTNMNIHLFIHSANIYWCLLYARHCSRHQKIQPQTQQTHPYPHGAHILVTPHSTSAWEIWEILLHRDTEEWEVWIQNS